jgi:tetratricopeptide (TPR) repeat protein
VFALATLASAQEPAATSGALAEPTPSPELARARSLLEQGRVPEAEEVARAFASSHATSADAHFLLGLILFRKSDPRGSLVEYTTGAKYRVPSALDLIVVGSNYVELHDYPDADKWFTKAVEFDPANLTALYYLGRTKYNENRFSEAVAAFERCLQIDPKNIRAEDNLGLSYQGMQRIEDAKAAFKSAIEWQGAMPKDPGPFIDMGALLLDGNDLNTATGYLEKAREIAPSDERARMQLGKTYLRMDRLSDAQREFEKAEELNPNDASLHYMLGQVYRKAGLATRAAEEFAMYSKLNGERAKSQQTGDDLAAKP